MLAIVDLVVSGCLSDATESKVESVSHCLAHPPVATKELHGALHPPNERRERNRERAREEQDLHGEHHHHVVNKFGADPLASSGHGRMQLCFQVVRSLVSSTGLCCKNSTSE